MRYAERVVPGRRQPLGQADRPAAPDRHRGVDRGQDYRARNPLRWGQIRATVAGCTVDGYVGCAQALADFSYTARLGGVAAPVLVACGSEDPRATPEESRRIAALFADGRSHEFTGARHVPNVEQAAAFNRVLLDWLAQVRAA